jgi:hypothetical protein
MTTFRTLQKHCVTQSSHRRSARVSTRSMLACTLFSMGLGALSLSDCVNGASRAATNRADAQISEMLVGTWKTRAWGEQVLTNKADGTGSLDVELNRLAAIRYGRELELNLKWTVENGVLSHTLISGSPQRRVDRLIHDFGASTRYRVVEVTDSALVLEELDDSAKRHVWEAVTENDTQAAR